MPEQGADGVGCRSVSEPSRRPALLQSGRGQIGFGLAEHGRACSNGRSARSEHLRATLERFAPRRGDAQGVERHDSSQHVLRTGAAGKPSGQRRLRVEARPDWNGRLGLGARLRSPALVEALELAPVTAPQSVAHHELANHRLELRGQEPVGQA